MNSSMNSRRTAARAIRQQRKQDAGFMADQFPGVASIVIKMTYNQTGLLKALPRVVNFFPGSYAVFRVDCLNRECDNGGFDLTTVITQMIKAHKKAFKGDLGCEGARPSPDHSTIAYKVSIRYA